MRSSRFDNQVVLITGGGAGIGRATARRIASEGGRLALLDWSEDDLRETAQGILDSGADCISLCGDVARAEDCQRLVDQAIARWRRLDVLVANAAVRAFGSALDASEEDWQRVLGVNLRGVANAAVAGGRAMKEVGSSGAMVLVSSTMALRARADMPIYDAAKAGVLSLTRSLAVDLAPNGIRVNSVCPGFTVTDFHIRRAAAEGRSADDLRARDTSLLRRPAEPEEIAAAIAFLASSDASYITATNLMVDGGRHAV